MSPFKKNLQKFCIIIFTAVPLVIIYLGLNRIKTTASIVEVPTPDQGSTATTPTPADQNTLPTQTSTPANTIGTFPGKTYGTPYGNVQASIQVNGGQIVAVTMPKVPNSPPSKYAQSYLIEQAMTAGSANIQGVSGATYTSLAFKQSLESAIIAAQAKLGTLSPSSASSPAVPGTTVAPSVPRRYED